MTQPRLKIAIATYGHTKDIKSGALAIAGVEPDFVEVVPIIGAFRRMVRDVEFDVCEMAPTTYMIARALGAPFIALPIFVMRRFHHGVNEYGLDSSKVTWVVDDEEHVTSLKLPPNVVHAWDGKSLASMMESGELQAGFSGPAGIGRAGPPTGAWEQRAPANAATYPELIADAPEVEAQWFRRTGIYPIHGLIVVKTSVLAQHPFVARSLFDAFLKAKDAYVARLKAGEGDSADDVKYRKLMALMNDPLPYGMTANRPSIEALVTYSLQQKLIPSRPQLDQVFVEIDP